MVTTSASPEADGPARLLIVSATMGEGHNATARALRAAARRVWPGVEVEWADVLDVMGRGTGPVFRWIYATSVERLPWLYEFFYASVWHHRWFAKAAKRVIGAWSGRRLAAVIDAVRPDAIVSTYPMGSTGLEWLRRHRGLSVPTAAWVSDIAPHPSWVHEGVSVNLVMHEVAVEPARRSVPGAPVAVSAPPVPERFTPGDRGGARARLGLPATGLLAVVSCGSLAFGDPSAAVRELLGGDPAACVVVVTGRDGRLRRRLERGFAGDERVRVLGWVDDMATLMTAADLVVTNAGGATALEALACGRAVVLHDPIPGHGKANARLLEEAGLARVCVRPGELAGTVRELARRPERLRALEEAARRHASAHRLDDDLRAFFRLPGTARARPLPAPDALFLHASTPEVPQYVGTALVFEPGPPLTRKDAAGMLAAVPDVGGRLLPARTLRRARWDPGEHADPLSLVDEVESGDLARAVDAFFSLPLDTSRALGAARLVTGLPGGRRALLVKLHHALGDGMTVLQALLSDTDTSTGLSWAIRPTTSVGGNGFRPAAGKLAGGLWELARAGRAPATPLDVTITGPDRHHAVVRLPGREVRKAARALGVAPADLLKAVFAEAVHDVLGARPGARFRLMAPWSLRGTGSMRAAGNHTGAVSVDLPVGPMDLRTRASLVADGLRRRIDAGVPEAAHAVVRLIGRLPPRLHTLAARSVYRGDWFNAIGTVMPGPRREIRWHGSVMSEAYPVLALAPGSGLAWGAMTWGHWVTMVFTGTPAHAALVDGIAARTHALFAELAGDHAGP
ncbi:wax ester/triacylglycerol synthase domain-containing protein [Prauserella flavalba]|uniref:wax ester/triacylglycerol synthase domain-containing protein n=1 Tax=Prauserella flavalba TaxID=1477506 RepID=UPI0011B7112D|nr:wax ester/triacylglycerol synthase domain-containing protein [Prauserella flavalba]